MMHLDVQNCLDLWPCVKIMVAVCNGYTTVPLKAQGAQRVPGS